MMVAFTLSMPGTNSWNGQWSGEDRPHVIVRAFRKLPEHDGTAIAPGRYSYDFGDGWRAAVDVELVDRSRAQKLRRRSAGFSTYAWMVDEIVRLGRIQTLQERTA